MNRTAVEEIKARIPIEELISSYLKLDKAGKSYKARCPFHNEKSASFFVSPDRGGYYCFGCGAKGDIFSFVEQFEGLDFRGALKVLAERAGVKLELDKKADSEKDKLFEITEQAAKFFEDQLLQSKEADDYVKNRGINADTRKSFRIGWAPLGWKNLYLYLKGKGWNDSFIEKAGLIKKPEGKSEFYDRFRGRVIFPITDSSGRVVAFTGRILVDDGKSAKYLNSPDTPLFNKSDILFGLDKAKSEIRRVGYSILVEGQMDLVLSHQVGVKNTIAASGTALTDQANGQSGVVSNLGMVRRLSSNMIIALDSDKAGKAAAMRAVAATALQMGMSVKIADIQGGKDPADLIKNNPEDWKDALRNAKHVIEFELSNVLAETKDTRNVAKAVRERVFPFLSRIESEMDKAFYVKHISEKTGFTELAVWEDLKKVEKQLKDNAGTKTGTPVNSPKLENHSQKNEASKPHRLDLVERRMFGLLYLMEEKNISGVSDYRKSIESISGSDHEKREQQILSAKNDVIFEAESFYGADAQLWHNHMKELIMNYEEDMINNNLLQAMTDLRIAEKSGDNKKVEELAKKCQVLSIRKAELNKQRKS